MVRKNRKHLLSHLRQQILHCRIFQPHLHTNTICPSVFVKYAKHTAWSSCLSPKKSSINPLKVWATCSIWHSIIITQSCWQRRKKHKIDTLPSGADEAMLYSQTCASRVYPGTITNLNVRVAIVNGRRWRKAGDGFSGAISSSRV